MWATPRVVLALVVVVTALAFGDGDPTVELEPLGHEQWMDAVEDAFHIDPGTGTSWSERQRSTPSPCILKESASVDEKEGLAGS